jgi:hypothetical protein
LIRFEGGSTGARDREYFSSIQCWSVVVVVEVLDVIVNEASEVEEERKA